MALSPTHALGHCALSFAPLLHGLLDPVSSAGAKKVARVLEDTLALRPDSAATACREYSKWHQSGQAEHMPDGLRRGALDIPESGFQNHRRERYAGPILQVV